MKAVRGLLAGLTATIAVSIVMLLEQNFGLVPDLDIVALLTQVGADSVGLPPSPVLGWIGHVLIGTVAWGVLFAATFKQWQGSPMVKGIAFAIAAWLLMMVVFMPVAGARIFGAALGPEAAISTFVLHLLFGAVLGVTFGALTDSRRPSRLQQRRPSQRSAQEFEEPPVVSQRLARRLH